ncbi:hypothetical protein SAMN06893096_10752 [Geodermatophilus pulveris]|uniref:AMIN-like domain-containing protein n=1 Tax=Geodermatophilus pulveris TaxID=1564159 RepID=A0A239GUG7_9ACTN|nr:hypothetical protein [Geodermatophilus pulveris]SNS72438.1 hypothetical protein SAMN06893096_10752 [Geodermatophilus pulveris]
MNRTRVLVVSVLAALGVVVPAPAGAAPACATAWGSLPEVVGQAGPGDDRVYDVRAGQHACFDRVVVDVAEVSGLDSWSVRYVPVAREDGSGAAVPLRGGAVLQVTLGAVAHDAEGRATYAPADRREVVDVRGWSTLRQVAWLGSFEGRSDIGIGTRARLPFRVWVLEGRSGSGHDVRLVIDVAHRW